MEFMPVYKGRISGDWAEQGLFTHQALADIHETKHGSKTMIFNLWVSTPLTNLILPEDIYIAIHNNNKITVMK